jgi:two-component system OmpR family sensor kinase
VSPSGPIHPHHRRHHRRHQEHRRRYWLQRYLRARLHRRIFLTFGLTIALMLGVVFGGFFLSRAKEVKSWGSRLEDARDFAAGRFERVWTDPPARSELAGSLASQLGFHVALEDASGRVFESHGSGCTGGYRIPIAEQGAVVLCHPSAQEPKPRFWWLLLAASLVVWMGAGSVARRLTRPLAELARFAEALGQGKFDARLVSREWHGEFGVLAHALNDMASRIGGQISDQRELLAAVSHELRTPLARIRILAELVREEGASDKRAKDIEREVVEMDALVGELLARSKLEFTGVERRPLQAEQLARHALERAGLPFTLLRTEGAELSLEADPTLLGRALANLLENARKYGLGVAAMKVSATSQGVVFSVEDSGPGFDPQALERLFKPFSRGTQTRGEASGLGLGLSLVRRIAEAHGGTATAENLPAGGARVSLEIPRNAPRMAEPA